MRCKTADCCSAFCKRFFKMLVRDLQVVFARDVDRIPKPGCDDVNWELLTKFSFSACPQIVCDSRPWDQTRSPYNPCELSPQVSS